MGFLSGGFRRWLRSRDEHHYIYYGTDFDSDFEGRCVPTPVPTHFVDLQSNDALQTTAITYGQGHRSWSQVGSGLNIEGKCTHWLCPANGKRVICPMQFGEFNIITDESRCPACSYTVKAITCGFTDCNWMYRGRKQGSEVDISSEWQIVGDEYERFREAGNMVGWEVLIINATPNPVPGPQCVLCLRDMWFVEEHKSLACGCRFHSDCVDSWKRHETKCPTCGAEIKKRNWFRRLSGHG